MTTAVGLIGCGHISKTHLEAWRRMDGCTVRGVFDLDRELAARCAARAGVPVFDTVAELVGACGVVDVCTPPRTHAELALEVIGAGKHLLIEKPLVTRLEEWHRVRSALDRSPGKLAVVHNLKFAAAYLRARRWIERGRIGRVIRVARRFLTSPNSDRMLGGRHWSHDLPGGRWVETLPHELYLIHDLPVASVTAFRSGDGPAGAAADEVTIALGDHRGAATIEYSARCDVNLRTLEIHGTRSSIVVDLLSDHARLLDSSDRRWRRAAGRAHLEAARVLGAALPDRAAYLALRLAGRTPHRRLIEAAARHFRGLGPSPTPLDEVAYVVETTDLIGREIDRRYGRNGS